MTERVQLQRKDTSAEAEGGHLSVYTPIATVWARVRRLSARQAFESDARGREISHSVVIRHRTDLKPGDRVVLRGEILEIAACSDLNGQRAYLNCQCIARAVTG